MVDDELLKLYEADQAERKKFSLLRDEAKKIEMRKTTEANDAIRLELVAELVPRLNIPKLISARDCFYAATIYSRGTTLADFKKAYDYANKAYSLVQFKDDDFALQVRSLYNDVSKKLRNHTQSIQTKDEQNSPFQMQPAPQRMAKKQAEEEKEREKQKLKPPKCGRCGKEHFGMCPPKP
jgi:hypothetical protein